MLQQQSWFLGDLERKVLNCRERIGSVYEVVASQRRGADHGADDAAGGRDVGYSGQQREAWAGRAPSSRLQDDDSDDDYE
jgi:hypothetical protein